MRHLFPLTIEVTGIDSEVQPNDDAEAIFVAAQKNKNLVEYTGGGGWLSRL